ncbi:MAG: DUF3977 family protein [Alphaproteobacteria bacterium]|nr:DUF3977 family protein [Alphaproteobacteria bacterium]
MKKNIFTEFGLDFDNNKFGLGYSTEIEKSDGTEYRVKKFIQMDGKSYYFRFWIFKTVFFVSKRSVELVKKKRNNFKIVFGIAGYNQNYL